MGVVSRSHKQCDKSHVDQSFVVNQNQNKFIDSECAHELGLEVLVIKQIKSTCKRREMTWSMRFVLGTNVDIRLLL